MTDQPQEFYIPERALVVVAHADDIEFGMAGTITRWTDAGAHVTYCIITDNSAGSNEPGADLVALAETRQREQIASAKVCGVEDVRFLGYQDGILQPTMELRKEITRIIREVRPQVVITLDPTTVFAIGNGYINHPDHRAAGEATIYAVFPSAGTRPIFPELLDEGYEPHDVDLLYMTINLESQVVVDISDVIDRKAEALRCHKSQLGEEAIEMVRKWNAEAGKEHGYAFAESFRVIDLRRPAPAENVAEPEEAAQEHSS